MTCEEAVVRERIEERTDDASDADFEVHRAFEDAFEPIDVEHAVVDNSAGGARSAVG